MTLGTKIFLRLFYQLVGQDCFGNKYYISKKKGINGSPLRSVSYAKAADPANIPPMWHAWLHYITDELPASENLGYAWQQGPSGNNTGTPAAYLPTNLKNKKKEESLGYQAWQPTNNLTK